MNIITKTLLLPAALLCLAAPPVLAAAPDETAPNEAAPPLVRMAHIKVKPGMRAAFIQAVTAGMREALKKEPGVLALYCVADKTDPDRLIFFEMYADEAAYTFHVTTPHFKRYIEATRDMLLNKELVETIPVELRDQHNTPREYSTD